MDFVERQVRRVEFAVRVLKRRLWNRDSACPYCAHAVTNAVARKYRLLELRRCVHCGLSFRWPKDNPVHSIVFYQHGYREGMTTDCPAPGFLKRLKENCFAGTEKDFRQKIDLLRALVPHGSVLDYGCSWGYGSFQLSRAGYKVTGFDISKPRALFARENFDIPVVSEQSELDGITESFDAVFASHVLEHLPSLEGTFDGFVRLLKPGGLLLAFVPNCGGASARRLGVKWGPMCCEKHTIAFDRDFFISNLPRHGFAVATFTDPYPHAEELPAIVEGASVPPSQHGDELVVCAIRKV